MSPRVPFCAYSVTAIYISFSSLERFLLFTNIILSSILSILKNSLLNAGCVFACACVQSTGSKLEVTSIISSSNPLFFMFIFRISTGSSCAMVTLVTVSTPPSILFILFASSEKLISYLSGFDK